MTNETLVMAYDYNAEEPRFFSRYFMEEYQNKYNKTVSVSEALSSAISFPYTIQPKQFELADGTKHTMLDASVIDKGSADFAYYIGRILRNHPEGTKFRILSIAPNLLKKNNIKESS